MYSTLLLIRISEWYLLYFSNQYCFPRNTRGMINDFSPELLHIHVNIRTKMKRCFSNLYVSGTSVKKRRVKKKEKKRTSEECYTGEKENVQDPYGVYWWMGSIMKRRARVEQQWTPFSNSTLSTNREIMYAENNCRLKANRWIFIRGLRSLRRNNNRNSRSPPSKKYGLTNTLFNALFSPWLKTILNAATVYG